jgi:ribosomal-protein-alanine N-acetyltransferase
MYICTMYHQTYQTERLSIRLLTKEDITTWTKFFDDPIHLKHLPLPPQPGMSNYEKAEFWVEKQFARYKEDRFGLMALVNKETNEMIGMCGLLSQELDGEKVLEVGYHLLYPYWGKGYASEAAAFFKDLAFKNNYATELVSIIDEGNIPSENVAKRNGMKWWKATTYQNLSVNIYRIIKD